MYDNIRLPISYPLFQHSRIEIKEAHPGVGQRRTEYGQAVKKSTIRMNPV